MASLRTAKCPAVQHHRHTSSPPNAHTFDLLSPVESALKVLTLRYTPRAE